MVDLDRSGTTRTISYGTSEAGRHAFFRIPCIVGLNSFSSRLVLESNSVVFEGRIDVLFVAVHLQMNAQLNLTMAVICKLEAALSGKAAQQSSYLNLIGLCGSHGRVTSSESTISKPTLAGSPLELGCLDPVRNRELTGTPFHPYLAGMPEAIAVSKIHSLKRVQ